MALSPSQLLASNTFIKELQEDPRFQAVMAEIETMRPEIPAYLPQTNKLDGETLVEKIKFAFGEQRGFDRIFALLTGRTPG